MSTAWLVWLGLWRGLQRTFAGVGKTPLVGGLLIALALAYIGQFREIYLSYAEQLYAGGAPGWWGPTVVQSAVALVVMGLLSAIIYISSKSLGRHGIEDAFQEAHANLVDPRLEIWVKTVGIFAALLPWVGLISGIKAAIFSAREHIDTVVFAQEYFGRKPFAISPIDFQQHVAFRKWLDGVDGMLGKLPTFWPTIFWLAVAMVVWLCRWNLIRLPVLVLKAIVSRVMPTPAEAALPVMSLTKTARTRWNDRTLDAVHRTWLLHRPAALRMCGNLLVAAVAVLTLANIAVPFILESIIQVSAPAPYRNAALGWNGWAELHRALHAYAWLPNALGLWSLSVLAFGVVLFVLVSLLRHSRRCSSLMTGAYAVVALLTAGLFVAGALTGLMEFGWVDVARGIGPLAIALLLGLIVLAIIIGLCLVGRHNGVPALVVVIAVAIVVVASKHDKYPAMRLVPPLLFGGIAISLFIRGRNVASCVTIGVALVSGLAQFKLHEKAEPRRDVADSVRPIGDKFDEWYKLREPRWRTFTQRGASRKFPVFIIAAEGGGIYAAAAASAFLSRLQERCPAFAQHVFAISGVSGGAVGSVVFNNAIDTQAGALVGEGCRNPRDLTAIQKDRAGTLQSKVAQVIKDDHLSPLTGLVVPDIFGTYSDRASGLRNSLDRSMGVAFAPKYDPKRKFLQHWAPGAAAPALVLNTTWVRVGNRVVFAPFEIKTKFPLATLGTFSGVQGNEVWSPSLDNITLTDAAVTSARFPGVLAAAEFEAGKTSGVRRWSFVDGGYVDASGALTAHEIYRSLQDYALEHALADKVDLRLILLTGSQSNKEENGTKERELKDLVAPIVALFSVRGLLSRAAVLETLAKLETADVDKITNLNHPTQIGAVDTWKAMTVELNHDEFKLELGWKLSNLTYDIVSLQLGQADLCASDDRAKLRRGPQNAEAETRVRALEVAKTIRANSCVMASIERLLGASPSP